MNSKEMTEQVLDLWTQTDAFQQSIATRSEKLSYTFYDGPPFTSGDPHYGHLLQSIVKDMVPRWMTMRGYRVARKRGRDCHGIPAENFVNKKLGITSKKQVEEEFGLKNYIEACRSMVNQVNDNRKWTIDRIGRWVDMENAYFTMDINFMESVISLFSNLYHRNLIYKGFKVLGYSRALGTALSNSEIAEGYEMRQDPAVTVKFPLKNDLAVIGTEFLTHPADNAVEVVAGVLKDEKGRVLMIFKNKHNAWYFPGGKMEAGESPVDTLKREILEEIGVEVTSEVFLGHAKTVHRSKLYRLHYFEITVAGNPQIQEVANHGMLEWVEKIPSENEFGYVLKFADLIIADANQLRHEFADIHMLENGLIGQENSGAASVSILPWTTTPWTLPANMFAAVHRDVDYMQIFDTDTQEYYILAEECLSKYYKSSAEYIEVTNFKGAELVGLSYVPLFHYYNREQYTSRIHKILHADFVTIESGTGIVHEAPAFGADDYELVAGILGKDNAQEWLFDPVNEYGEFTTDASDFAGQNVIEANSAIIKELKSRGLLVKQETINHSYPHCPRTKTPLIYKAIESWFVKEEELKTLTVPAAEQIRFVPETVKQRFINGLASAPDWNISRTRYRGAPLPVWVSADGEVTKVVGSLEEIFQANKIKKQLTKIILVRHGRSDYNELHLLDSENKAVLHEYGIQQAHDLVVYLEKQKIDVLYCSPFQRCIKTLAPYCEMQGQEINIDERLREVVMPAAQDKDNTHTEWVYAGGNPVDMHTGESLQEVEKRVIAFYQEIIQKHPGETVLICSHGDPLLLLKGYIKGFDYDSVSDDHYPANADPMIEYVRSDTGKMLDLHRPYIDSIVLIDETTGKELNRIPEVLDCWFESGAMPYGQDHFMHTTAPGVKNQTSGISNLESDVSFSNCANFIAEGLDQTRGWFRALHVLGHAYHGQNVFQNVVVTGMILAEDGKKMSKSLQNYPDPTHLINQYGADALRLYLLGSPVVRAEPLRFSEKGVEQMLKDVVIPLQNVFNFFKMYAQVDQRKDQGTQVRFMRHALKKTLNIQKETETGWITAEGENIDDIELPLSDAGFAQLSSPEFIEQVVRIDPEVIICSDYLRAQQTAEGVQSVLRDYLGKEVQLEIDTHRGRGAKPESEYGSYNTKVDGEYAPDGQAVATTYQELLEKYAGKRILIVSHKRRFRYLRQWLFDQKIDLNSTDAREKWLINSSQAVVLPLGVVNNELDQWVLAELHRTISTVDSALKNYSIEEATLHLMGFVDKLTNRYLRRSRRRFRTEAMTADKQQAYDTLFTVIRTYLQLCAPFIPFVTEQLRQELGAFTSRHDTHPSVHLQSRPTGSAMYINEQLIEEIETVRKIIKGALYLRSKHQVKVKQPLPSLSFKI